MLNTFSINLIWSVFARFRLLLKMQHYGRQLLIHSKWLSHISWPRQTTSKFHNLFHCQTPIQFSATQHILIFISCAHAARPFPHTDNSVFIGHVKLSCTNVHSHCPHTAHTHVFQNQMQAFTHMFKTVG